MTMCSATERWRRKTVHGQLTAQTEDAYGMARYLARNEGLFVGVSAAAAVFVSVQLARTMDQGLVVTVLPDGGWKYMSEPYWTDEDRAG